VQMQDKISYCPAPLGRGATPYTVQYSGVPRVQLQTVIMAFLNASIVIRLTICSGSVLATGILPTYNFTSTCI